MAVRACEAGGTGGARAAGAERRTGNGLYDYDNYDLYGYTTTMIVVATLALAPATPP